MLPVPDASLEAKADLLGQITCRNQLFSCRHIVIFDKHHLQPGGNLGVLRNDLGEGQQRMDDVLGDDVGRCRLGTKDADQRHSGQVPCLDFIILVDEVEQVQLLALVLMQALGLNIKKTAFVFTVTFWVRSSQSASSCLLAVFTAVSSFSTTSLPANASSFFQLGGILAEAGADVLFQHLCQARVTFQQPAAEGDAVGLVVELLGVQLIEAVQLGVLQNFGVQGCNAVGGVGKVDVHVRHVYPIILVDNGEALVLGAGARQLIQLSIIGISCGTTTSR